MKYSIMGVILILAGSFGGVFGQQDRVSTADWDIQARKQADTSRFMPNKKSDWSLYNSYLDLVGKDSALLEATIYHGRDIKWTEYQYFGTITDKKILPSQSQEVKYFLLADAYSIKIEPNGNCHIKLVDGQLPPRDPVILPIRIVYKRI